MKSISKNFGAISIQKQNFESHILKLIQSCSFIWKKKNPYGTKYDLTMENLY